jgi:hypothetical protein
MSALKMPLNQSLPMSGSLGPALFGCYRSIFNLSLIGKTLKNAKEKKFKSQFFPDKPSMSASRVET